jgi:hypothetical protein
VTFRRALALLSICSGLASCAVFTSRPTQEFSDTAAALRAAKEVQADVLAPELFRQADDWFFKAKREFKFKNFRDAKEYAAKARKFAEQAEFEALRNGGSRADEAPKDTAPPTTAKPTPYEYPSPTPTPAEEIERKNALPVESNQSPQSNEAPTGNPPGVKR